MMCCVITGSLIEQNKWALPLLGVRPEGCVIVINQWVRDLSNRLCIALCLAWLTVSDVEAAKSHMNVSASDFVTT